MWQLQTVNASQTHTLVIIPHVDYKFVNQGCIRLLNQSEHAFPVMEGYFCQVGAENEDDILFIEVVFINKHNFNVSFQRALRPSLRIDFR